MPLPAIAGKGALRREATHDISWVASVFVALLIALTPVCRDDVSHRLRSRITLHSPLRRGDTSPQQGGGEALTGRHNIAQGVSPVNLLYVSEKVLDTPKPAGELSLGQRGVVHPHFISDTSCRLAHVFPYLFLFHPSSHVVLLACRLRGVQYILPA